MNQSQRSKKITVADILNYKNNEKIVCLTAYTYPVAKAIDGVCEIILVGDSLGMTIYGMKDTIDVSVEMMKNHGLAVMRAVEKSFVIVDIPANSFENSPKQALDTAKFLINETGCDAVKIETSKKQIEAIELMVKNNIPTVSHVGLLPQKVREIGGYKYQGRLPNQAQEIIEIAKMSEDAGAFACVIEAVPSNLADEISGLLKIPTIGIGASKNCDGQVLVIDDILGLNQEFTPKFVKKYEDIFNKITSAARAFSRDVKIGNFPQNSNLLEK